MNPSSTYAKGVHQMKVARDSGRHESTERGGLRGGLMVRTTTIDELVRRGRLSPLGVSAASGGSTHTRPTPPIALEAPNYVTDLQRLRVRDAHD